MGFMAKLRNRLTMSKGRAKQGVGRAAGDPYLEGRGRAERVEGAGRQVGEQVKDAGKNVRDAFKHQALYASSEDARPDDWVVGTSVAFLALVHLKDPAQPLPARAPALAPRKQRLNPYIKGLFQGS